VPTLLCDSWLRSGALVRVFAVELPTRDAYFLAAGPRCRRPQVKALTRWALAQYSVDENLVMHRSILFFVALSRRYVIVSHRQPK